VDHISKPLFSLHLLLPIGFFAFSLIFQAFFSILSYFILKICQPLFHYSLLFLPSYSTLTSLLLLSLFILFFFL
jgi:hypothetical protein